MKFSAIIALSGAAVASAQTIGGVDLGKIDLGKVKSSLCAAKCLNVVKGHDCLAGVANLSGLGGLLNGPPGAQAFQKMEKRQTAAAPGTTPAPISIDPAKLGALKGAASSVLNDPAKMASIQSAASSVRGCFCGDAALKSDLNSCLASACATGTVAAALSTSISSVCAAPTS